MFSTEIAGFPVEVSMVRFFTGSYLNDERSWPESLGLSRNKKINGFIVKALLKQIYLFKDNHIATNQQGVSRKLNESGNKSLNNASESMN